MLRLRIPTWSNFRDATGVAGVCEEMAESREVELDGVRSVSKGIYNNPNVVLCSVQGYL